MPYIRREDCRLYYEIHGEGEPFIMLHGNGEDHTYFEHQIQYYKVKYQVIVMDTRGHGLSGLGQKELNFSLFAQDVIALLNELGIEKCFLLGFSDGGNTALTLAIQYPTRFYAIIANGANHRPTGVKWYYQLPIILGYGSCKLISLYSKKAKSKTSILNLMVHHPHLNEAELMKIHLPILLLVGSNDMIKPTESEFLHRAIATSQLCTIKGDHFIARKSPDAVHQAIDLFISAI